jgi:hypothetical protein
MQSVTNIQEEFWFDPSTNVGTSGLRISWDKIRLTPLTSGSSPTSSATLESGNGVQKKKKLWKNSKKFETKP